MKRQRPTIRIWEWKLAINLEATRKVQNQEGVPAYNCDCEWCSNWRRHLEELLPKELKEQLLRVGIELEHPTDVYQFDRHEKSSSIRVTYHAVGKILEGPNQWAEGSIGTMLMYYPVRKEPRLSLVILPERHSFEHAPVLKDSSAGELIHIDMRLEVPDALICSSSDLI